MIRHFVACDHKDCKTEANLDYAYGEEKNDSTISSDGVYKLPKDWEYHAALGHLCPACSRAYNRLIFEQGRKFYATSVKEEEKQ